MYKLRVVPSGTREENMKHFYEFYSQFNRQPKIYANTETIKQTACFITAYGYISPLPEKYSQMDVFFILDGVEYYCTDKLWLTMCDIDISEGLLYLVAEI